MSSSKRELLGGFLFMNEIILSSPEVFEACCREVGSYADSNKIFIGMIMNMGEARGLAHLYAPPILLFNSGLP